ncbi:MAG: Glyoxalase/bleomycin resistance protein/dioxygenase, partial [Verrucomicrobiaceae bacterium]|nr:Glyoxalase/bleomycin resistance protein/dioxygenase [Verrucomicrobiaceae bacterium]
KSPTTLGGSATKFVLMVPNADAAFAKAIAVGATEVRAPQDQFYGFRAGTLRDPFGHEWMLQHEFEKVSPEEMQQRWNGMMKKCD